MLHHDTLYAECLGLDYAVAIDLHLYYRVFHDEVCWAIANRCQCYRGGPLNYEPKLHLGFVLEPLDLYVRHMSNAVNVFCWVMLPYIAPTRYQRILKSFPNYSDL